MLRPDPALLWTLAQDERGSTATEYAMLAALVAIFAIAGVVAFADAAVALWEGVSATVIAAIG